MVDQERHNRNESIRRPIKPRTMTQAPIPAVESAFLDTSPDGNLTNIEKCKSLAMYEVGGGYKSERESTTDTYF